jgi:hypothetical protein
MEMLLLLNTLKEQQIRILLGKPALATASTDGNPMPMLLRQIGFITVNFKLEVIYFNKLPHSQVIKSMLNKMNYQETTDWMFNQLLCINFKVRLLIRRT